MRRLGASSGTVVVPGNRKAAVAQHFGTAASRRGDILLQRQSIRDPEDSADVQQRAESERRAK
jgi:hypothetical protein